MGRKEFKQKLQTVKELMEEKLLDEIPLSSRPPMPDVDYDKETYVIVSYSRKDFVEVYLFLDFLYRNGYRFWYDNGMQGVDTWLNEFEKKYENPNCLGTITFFSNYYISNATKEELGVIYQNKQYRKHNMMLSLMALSEMDSEDMLINAIYERRISIRNAADIEMDLAELIKQEKEKTIHRYGTEEDIPFLVEKLDKLFSIRGAAPQPFQDASGMFFVVDGVLRKYVGRDCADVVIPEGITKIDDGAFAACTDIVSVAIPETVTEIGMDAFSGCLSLTEVTIPNSIEIIPENAFRSCYSLKRITIPNSVRMIADAAFDQCSDLESVTLPEGLRDIYHEAFYGCALREIVIPQSVTFIGNGAFRYCEALERIIYEGTKAQWKRIDLGDIGISRVQCIDGEIEAC